MVKSGECFKQNMSYTCWGIDDRKQPWNQSKYLTTLLIPITFLHLNSDCWHWKWCMVFFEGVGSFLECCFGSVCLILIIFGNIFNVFAPIWSMGNLALYLYYLVIFILFEWVKNCSYQAWFTFYYIFGFLWAFGLEIVHPIWLLLHLTDVSASITLSTLLFANLLITLMWVNVVKSLVRHSLDWVYPGAVTKIPFSVLTPLHITTSILSQTRSYSDIFISRLKYIVNIWMFNSHDIQKLRTSRVFLSLFLQHSSLSFSVSLSCLISFPSSTASLFLYFPCRHPHI